MSQIPEEHPRTTAELLEKVLRPGERLMEPPAHTTSDLRDRYGYEIYPIQNADGEVGSSVFLVMERQGDAVEPVELVGPVKLTITPVMGEGLVVVHVPGQGVSPNLLAADGSPNDGGDIELVPGYSYCYLNTGTGPFVVRDDSVRLADGKPHFDSSYEVPAVNTDLLDALAKLDFPSLPPQE